LQRAHIFAREDIEMSALEERNIEIVTTMAKNGILGHWDIVKQYVSDDMVMHVPAGLPYGGDYRGWDGYLRCFKEMGTFFAGLKSDAVELASSGNKVIVMTRMSGQIAKNGKPISFPITTVWTLSDGKVVDILPFYYDTKSIADLAAQG
jgi:ketosteroid isomerase-like protein